ncbi:nucleoside-diphosphate-sugar epimerase family protein [Ophiostoma piceae UAMH 11346]|uniref:Nucleoside-diphosphate-sugar epimerase family protein n=1 Tax=Ophiostoma piceae (strain UAMH 11346) TaxID=1262450 RepID=S3BRN0_OPHP1|nr:nucleoside-diphosphate-sugar epimerase family protein [Ophiostoma piceae UAMH 11346]
MPAAVKPTVLVVGATGKQGGGTINGLLADKSPAAQNIKILALTRDASSPRAKALAAKSDNIEIIEGDQLKPAAIFASLPKGSVTDLFLVTVPPKEEPQAIPFIDEAIAHGVQNIVFASVERGGDDRSWTNPTDVPHFAEKYNIEVHLRDVAAKAESPVTWTILRPAAFMDNLKPGGQFCAIMVSMWSISLKNTKKLQMIATSDVGLWAADSIVKRIAANGKETPYTNKAFGLAGTEVTLTEMRAEFKRIVGKESPWAWWIFGRMLLLFVSDMGRMFRWFDREGFGADINQLRTAGPGPAPKTLEQWLRTESGWVKE